VDHPEERAEYPSNELIRSNDQPSDVHVWTASPIVAPPVVLVGLTYVAGCPVVTIEPGRAE
jgi:hypothetical protein